MRRADRVRRRVTASEQRAEHRELGLTDAEYELIVELLGREPNDVELAMFSLLWSEHCAYKHSKKLLRRLPTEGERVVMGPGENAGAVDVGDGCAVAFKVESPQPPQRGRAVPGRGHRGRRHPARRLRARRAADRGPRLAALRRARLASARATCSSASVAGIGHYGNSIGVATVGGEIYFEAPYEQNCLVNAMCVGLARTDEMVRAGRRRGRQRGRADGRLDRPRRHRRRLACWPRPSWSEGDEAKRPDACRSATRSRRTS